MTDRGLEALMEFLQSLYSLEINGCNEITEQGLWSSLAPRLISLTVQVTRLLIIQRRVSPKNRYQIISSFVFHFLKMQGHIEAVGTFLILMLKRRLRT